MNLLVAHLVGDYILQNDYQALNKKKSSIVCGYHCLMYTLSVLVFSGFAWHWWAYPICFALHFVQDRWTLIEKWMELSGQTSFRDGPCKPWSTIAVDNTFHLLTLYLLQLLAG